MYFHAFQLSNMASVTFDPEVDLSNDAVSRSRYEWFYSVRSNYARRNLSLRRRSREPSRGCLTFTRLSRLNTFQRIARSLPNFFDYTRGAHVLHDIKY